MGDGRALKLESLHQFLVCKVATEDLARMPVADVRQVAVVCKQLTRQPML